MPHQHDEAVDSDDKHNGVFIDTIRGNLYEGRKWNGPEEEDAVHDFVHAGQSRGQQQQRKGGGRAGERSGNDYSGEIMPEYQAEQGIAENDQHEC